MNTFIIIGIILLIGLAIFRTRLNNLKKHVLYIELGINSNLVVMDKEEIIAFIHPNKEIVWMRSTSTYKMAAVKKIAEDYTKHYNELICKKKK